MFLELIENDEVDKIYFVEFFKVWLSSFKIFSMRWSIYMHAKS